VEESGRAWKMTYHHIVVGVEADEEEMIMAVVVVAGVVGEEDIAMGRETAEVEGGGRGRRGGGDAHDENDETRAMAEGVIIRAAEVRQEEVGGETANRTDHTNLTVAQNKSTNRVLLRRPRRPLRI